MESGRLLPISKAAICLCGLCLVFFIDGRNYSAGDDFPVAGRYLSGQARSVRQLSDGDLVFRRGRDIVSRLVLAQQDSPQFSHVGILVRFKSGLFVVHAIPAGVSAPGGVLVEPLNSFASFDNAEEIGFYRVKNINQAARRKVRGYALRQVGKLFDSEFLFSDSSRMYCTELVLKALLAAKIDITKSSQEIMVMMLREPMVAPGCLSKSRQLEKITEIVRH